MILPRIENYISAELKHYNHESNELGFNSFSDFVRFSIVVTLRITK